MRRHVPFGLMVYCLPTGVIGDGCHVSMLLRAVNETEQTFERIGMMELVRFEVVGAWLQAQGRECIITFSNLLFLRREYLAS
jgi:hypothetical protein